MAPQYLKRWVQIPLKTQLHFGGCGTETLDTGFWTERQVPTVAILQRNQRWQITGKSHLTYSFPLSDKRLVPTPPLVALFRLWTPIVKPTQGEDLSIVLFLKIVSKNQRHKLVTFLWNILCEIVCDSPGCWNGSWSLFFFNKSKSCLKCRLLNVDEKYMDEKCTSLRLFYLSKPLVKNRKNVKKFGIYASDFWLLRMSTQIGNDAWIRGHVESEARFLDFYRLYLFLLELSQSSFKVISAPPVAWWEPRG